MYSPRVVAQNLDLFAAREGWMPDRHSLGQVREFTEYISNLVKVDTGGRNLSIEGLNKNISATRAKSIRRWIQNEQVLCALDCNYWEQNYAYICNEKGEIFKFQNRKSQDVLDNIVAEFEERGVAIEMLCLKARQQGITSKTALRFLHKMLFVPHTQSVMASVQADKSELIERILNIAYSNCPWWLVPAEDVHRVGKMIGYQNGSVLSIQSGMQGTGIAQGWTPVNIHVSELADIPRPQKVIEEGLLRATHSSRKLFLVFEGTGGGNTGWLADKWRSAKEGWPLGTSRLRPVFIPWPMSPDLYPEKDWIRAHPVPPSWEPCHETKKQTRKAELFIRSTDYLAKVAGKDWKMPVEQQWFWEFNYLEAVKSHTQKIWLSQMPADDYEALTGKNDSVFDVEVIEVAERSRQQKYGVYGIRSHTIAEEFWPADELIDFNSTFLNVSWDSQRGEKYEWTLVPLLPFEEDSERQSFDKLLVFEEPGKGEYTIGIDTADGLGHEDEDRSVISVVKTGSKSTPDVQVAEFTTNRISPTQLAKFAACIAAFYSEGCGDVRGPKFCIEQRESPGDDCQFQLLQMGFRFHHKPTQYDRKNPKQTQNQGTKLGWFTTSWTRPILMNRFIDAVNGGWYTANSRYLLQELKDLERKVTTTGKTRLEHMAGKHDDRVFAAALSYITRHDFDTLAERQQRRYAPPVGRLPEVDLKPCVMGEMSVGD